MQLKPGMSRLAGLTLLLATAAGCGSNEPVQLTAEQVRTDPMILYMKIDGGFYVLKDAWHLYFDTTKGAWFTILRYPHQQQEELPITSEQLQAFRERVLEERLFEVTRERFGEDPGDAGIRGLRLSIGRATRSFELAALDNWEQYGADELDELRRVLRVWHVARGWFDAPAIVDYRDFDRAILDAAPPMTSPAPDAQSAN